MWGDLSGRRCDFANTKGIEIIAAQQPVLQGIGSAEDVLSYLVESGRIDMDGVAASMKKTEEERILKEKHPYKITCGKDGR